MKGKFRVGDHVKYVGSRAPFLTGKKGVVNYILSKTYVVEFECDGKKTWECFEDSLALEENETIVIYRKENQVIALDKRTGEKAVAKCDPRDIFDFKIGARIAFDRLLGDTKAYPEPVKPPLNTKIVFTKGDNKFKTGHIYEIRNGKIYVRKTEFYPINSSFYSIEDVVDYFRSHNDRKKQPGWSIKGLKFIEVKED